MKIQILPPEVVNQIAAGEVVERPSHLVKELIENSLDSGATRILVGVDPKNLEIEVEDNGSGMSRQDLELSIAPHTTSKIRLTEDLWKLSSFGFRGEALASISAVSDFSIRSRTHEPEARGYRLHSLFGRFLEISEVPASPGTRVFVKDLFSNLPARKKFLRSPQYELSSIRQVVKAMALSSPEVEFIFRVGPSQRAEFAFAPASLARRAQEVFDLPQVFEAKGEMASHQVRIIFSDPNTTQKSGKNIWIFVQNRWVQDKSVSCAINEAYRSLLMHGEFPYVAVFLDLPPGEVDVNIHPTKSQVKFADPKLIFQLVQKTLREELEKAPWLKALLGSSMQTLKDPSPTLYTSAQSSPHVLDYPTSSEIQPSFEQARFSLSAMSLYEEPIVPQRVLFKDSSWASLKLVGQVGRTYLVCQKESGVIFIDQHAAHERVLYERIIKAFKTNKPKVQDFLFPLILDTSAEQLEWIWAHRDQFEKIGLRLERAGPHQLQVESAPEWIKEGSIVQMFEEISRRGVDRGEQADFNRYFEPIASSLACHSAIRAGKALSEDEMRLLLEEMDEFPLSSFCPHGRPVFVEYPFSKLEKDFGRIV